MRILVGTLYSIENEFEECVEAINRQNYDEFEHIVIQGLPKREAHDRLYGTFMKHAHEFDLFMKVDADMVIENRDLFAQIVARFRDNPRMDLLTIEVHDCFTDSQIDGMSTFRNTVRWKKRDTDIFTDKHAVPLERSVYDSHDLAPAAVHCKNPSPFQAFHYGLHRAMKVREYLQASDPSRTNVQFHLTNRNRLWQHFLRVSDKRLGFAALATELTLRGDFGAQHIPYTNPFARQEFCAKYTAWSVDRIQRTTQFLRWRNKFIPAFLRYRLVLKRRNAIRRLVAGKAQLDVV